MMKKYFFIIYSLFFISGWSWGGNNPVNIYNEPRKLPDRRIFLYEENGKSHKINEFKGEFVIAIFWSRNCAPCIYELAKISKFQNKIKGNNIRIIMISPASEWVSSAEQRRFLKRFNADDLEYYVDKKGDLSADLGIFTSPNTVLINSKGQEIGRIRGAAEWDNDKMVDYIYNIKAKHD